jgi:type II secretory pathway pseudopilin PulG
MKNYFKKNKGFTITETIIYISIFSILIAGFTIFTDSMRKTRISSQTFFEVNDQGMQITTIISQALRNAASVASPAMSATSSSLTITTTIPATSPTVFNLNNGVLYITEGSGPAVALNNNKISVSNLIFYNLSKTGKPNTVQFRFKINNTDFYGAGSLRK